MANSLHEIWVRYDDTAELVTQTAVNAAIVRDCILNNSSHLCDEATQVRVNYAAKDGTYLETVGETGRQLLMTFGPFPLRMRPDGSSVKMRVRLNGSLAAAGTEDILFILGDAESWHSGVEGDENVATFELGSTTPSWVDAHVDNIISVPAGETPSLLTNIVSYGAVSGADPVAVPIYMAFLHVVAVNQQSANQIRVSGVYAAEYIGL
jgi:hypothetical protein